MLKSQWADRRNKPAGIWRWQWRYVGFLLPLTGLFVASSIAMAVLSLIWSLSYLLHSIFLFCIVAFSLYSFMLICSIHGWADHSYKMGWFQLLGVSRVFLFVFANQKTDEIDQLDGLLCIIHSVLVLIVHRFIDFVILLVFFTQRSCLW